MYMSHRIRKQTICILAKTKAQTSFAVTTKLINAFVFATQIVQTLFFLNPKVKSSRSSMLVVTCVGPGLKPELLVFSSEGSYFSNCILSNASRSSESHGYISSNCTADQRLCFRYTDSTCTIPLLLKPEISCFCDCTARFVSDLAGNPNYWFSHAQAHSIPYNTSL